MALTEGSLEQTARLSSLREVLRQIILKETESKKTAHFYLEKDQIEAFLERLTPDDLFILEYAQAANTLTEAKKVAKIYETKRKQVYQEVDRELKNQSPGKGLGSEFMNHPRVRLICYVGNVLSIKLMQFEVEKLDLSLSPASDPG